MGDEVEYYYDPAVPPNPENTSKRHVLIIDQFEEIFSTHPESWSKRGNYFEQLAQAMESTRYLWVILVMREDYIAALDPYAPLMPGGLRTRYYMQLQPGSAIKAVKGWWKNQRRRRHSRKTCSRSGRIKLQNR
jgi:hypothetical protein